MVDYKTDIKHDAEMKKTNSGDDKTNANFITSSRNAKAQPAILAEIIN